MELVVQNISKSFDQTKVLQNLSFTVTSGRAMGFLGRNGAGKTTTIRCLMDVFKPDSGAFLIDGKPFQTKDYKIGYMPEVRGLYEREAILDQLIYFGTLRGAKKEAAKQSALKWLKRVELEQYAKKNMEVLSKGNQQKVQIIQALINDPDILILDEPFSGLDPVNAQVLKDIIYEKIREGKLLIFSSHQMSYVEEFCDDIALLSNGKILVSGSLEDIKSEMSLNRYEFNCIGTTPDELISELKQRDYTVTPFQKNLLVTLQTQEQKKEFLNTLLSLNHDLELFKSYKPSLNDIFLEKVRDQ